MNAVWSLVTGVINAVLAVVTGGALRIQFHPQTHTKEFSVEVVRPDDLVVLTLDFYNIRRQGAGAGPLQVDRVAAGDGFIVAHFPPQSFAERAFYEAAPGFTPPPDAPPSSETPTFPPVASRIAGPSQLVFRVEPALLPFAFNVDTILEVLAKCEQVTQDITQRPPATPGVGTRGTFGGLRRSLFTAIEAPYRLVLSPDIESRWAHAFAPVQDAARKRTELWHTRLSPGATAAAVWSPDYNENNVSPASDDLPFRMSLRQKNRHEIVRSTSDPELIAARPVDVRQMMLTSQGAWLDVHGEWDPPLDMNLVEWQHNMTGGRDQYARIVEAGYYCPLGHRCVIVTITERRVQGMSGDTQGPPTAYLRQQKFIYTREFTKTYHHRDSPFRTVTFKTEKTPSLDLPTNSQILTFGENAFWPRVANQEFLFHVIATDWEGKVHEFHTPQAFVIKSLVDDGDPIHKNAKDIVDHINNLSQTDKRRDRPMHGQKIAYAPSIVRGDTTYETEKIIFGANRGTASPYFLPRMTKARVDVPAVRHLTGSTAFSTIQYRQDYLDTPGNTVIGNMGEVFADLVDGQTQVTFSSDQTGGMVSPNFAISGLSRGAGPVGGNTDNFAAGKFNPQDIFKNVKLFGGVNLAEIIQVGINLIPSGPDIPKLKTIRTKETIGGVSKEVFQTSYRWDLPAAGLVDQSKLSPKGMFKPKPNARFLIEAVTNTPVDGSKGTSTVHGLIENFTITLMPATPLVALHFTKAEFKTVPNAKTDFAIIFEKFEFLGELAFVNDLLEVIPLDGFNDPPFLRLTQPPGVEVGFTQGVPTISLGIFTLQNISFAASFYLPFLTGAALMRFAFCERQQPFTLTVSLFGGGGFFAIEIGLDGVKKVEASLEFGASIALNLGVASGSACIMGGVYYEGSPGGFVLVGYFRAAGCLTVLGFISVSVELYIAIGYASKGTNHRYAGRAWGQASLTIKVKIAFFSVSVSISMEREFAGSDPKFIETVSNSDWIEYCNAFADCPV